jgi:hypothetical protein
MIANSAPSKRSLWKRAALSITILFALLLLAIVTKLAAIAHRPSQLHLTITPAEIAAEDTRLQQLGLTLPDGSFLKPHPFEPPWTSHSLLIPSTWTEPGIKSLLTRHVRADLLLADLDVLQPVMERAYGGWDSAADRGWNWNQWFADWRKQLAAKGAANLSLDEAFAPVDSLLAFQRDNHTQIPLARHTGDGSQTALLATTPTAPCTELRANAHTFSIAANDPGQQVRNARQWTTGSSTFADTHYISMPASFGIPQAIRCGDAWIPLQPIGGRKGGILSLLNMLWEETMSRGDQAHIDELGDGIVYARLPTFVDSNYQRKPSQGWPQRHPTDRVLIVDLRNNQGNNADYGLNVLKGWIDESRMVPFEHIGSQIDSSCLYAPLKWNYPIRDSNEPSQQMLDRIAQNYLPGCPRTVDINPSQWTYLQHRFTPKPGDLRIIALVNSHCGSDCELMTAMLASLPETIVMGANTYGVVQNIQPGYSVLPHTGLAYRIALGRSDYYGDNRSVDGYGLDVDVVLPEVDTLNTTQLRQLAEAVAKQ